VGPLGPLGALTAGRSASRARAATTPDWAEKPSSTSAPASACRVLILAVATDCAGLTLVRANHLYLLDPVLSPAVFAQLVGRIARQGQTRPCFVYSMIVKGSVEEPMLRLRVRLAAGAGTGGSAATEKVDAAARKSSSSADANQASAAGLPMGDLLALLDAE
jgi:hypothetical protein